MAHLVFGELIEKALYQRKVSLTSHHSNKALEMLPTNILSSLSQIFCEDKANVYFYLNYKCVENTQN